jgi:hypothetical protein
MFILTTIEEINQLIIGNIFVLSIAFILPMIVVIYAIWDFCGIKKDK